MSKVTLYSKDDCVYCDFAKNYLTRKKIDFSLVDTTEYSMKTLVETTGSKSFPQIFVGEKFIGGYEELKNLKLDEVTDHRLKEISGEVSETMCSEGSDFDRFILFNGSTEFEYDDVYNLYKKEIACFWTVEEMDLSSDLKCWEDSSDDERHFIKMILAFAECYRFHPRRSLRCSYTNVHKGSYRTKESSTVYTEHANHKQEGQMGHKMDGFKNGFACRTFDCLHLYRRYTI